MTSSKTSDQGVDLDDLERQMRTVPLPNRSDDRLAELARMVGRNVSGVLGGRQQVAPAAPIKPSAPDRSFDEDEVHTEVGSARDSHASVDQAIHGDGVERVPESSDAAPRASKKRSHPSSRALAFGVSFLLVTVGVGVAVVMRAGPVDRLGSEPPLIKADDAPVQQAQVAAGDQTPSQPALGTAGSSAKSAKPDQPVGVVAATNPALPRNTVIPVALTMPLAAANVPLPDPPKPASESSIFGTPHRVVTVSVKPDATIMSKGKPEVAPLPPAKPRTLASADTTASARAKPSDASANAASASSFSIQLASSPSKSDALATLSRLKKQFPDVLGGGSIRRADGGGKSVFYQVQVGPLSRDAADKACSRLKASGENCIVVRS
jgi:sporulation related protein